MPTFNFLINSKLKIQLYFQTTFWHINLGCFVKKKFRECVIWYSFFTVFNFKMIFIFCPILIFSSSLFIVNSILTFYRYCFYFIYTDIAYMIYYNFLMVLTNSLSDIPSKLGSCFYVFQTMFLTVNFLHPTENLIQCLFQQAWILFFASWCFFIISKRSYVLNNFRNYFHGTSLTIFSYAFWGFCHIS